MKREKNRGRTACAACLAVLFFGLGVTAGGEESVGTDGGKDYRDPAVLSQLIETAETDYLLVDVRTEGEYRGGFIPGAVNIPVQIIGEQPPEVPKDRLIIVYCRSGARSSRAAGILRDLGYKNVQDFGGIYRWPGSLETP